MDILYVGLGNAAAATVLALVAAVAGRFCRGRPALVRSLWLLVLLRLLTPPLVCPRIAWPTLPGRAPDAPAAVGPAADLSAPTPTETPVAQPKPEPSAVADAQPIAGESDIRTDPDLPPPQPVGTESLPASPAPPALPTVSWRQAVLGIWLTGSIVWWFLAARRLHRFGRMVRQARPAPAAVQETAGRLASRLGLGRCPPVLFVPGQVPPLLWGVVGRPRVLLPAALWARLTAGQQETLLAHELAHLRRGDHWARRLELVALGLYWWHPVVWWARRRIQEAEEECCDACVVAALPEAAADYARALLTAIAFLSDTRAALPVGASGVGQVPMFKRRLAMILQGKTPRKLSRPGLVAVLGLGALLLPLLPSWGQTQTAEEKPTSNPTVAPASGARDTSLPGDGTTTTLADNPPRAGTAARPDITSTSEEPIVAGTAEEQVELLKAQLEVRRAEVEEAKALLEQATRKAKRMEELAKRGVAGSDVLEDAHTDVTVLAARLRGKEARLHEMEVQLKQAERRAGGAHASARYTATYTTSSAQAGPGRVGTSSAAVPVVPRQPPPVSTEARLRDLEKKIDGLLREVRSLRDEMNRTGGPAQPGSTPSSSANGAPHS